MNLPNEIRRQATDNCRTLDHKKLKKKNAGHNSSEEMKVETVTIDQQLASAKESVVFRFGDDKFVSPYQNDLPFRNRKPQLQQVIPISPIIPRGRDARRHHNVGYGCSECQQKMMRMMTNNSAKQPPSKIISRLSSSDWVSNNKLALNGQKNRQHILEMQNSQGGKIEGIFIPDNDRRNNDEEPRTPRIDNTSAGKHFASSHNTPWNDCRARSIERTPANATAGRSHYLNQQPRELFSRKWMTAPLKRKRSIIQPYGLSRIAIGSLVIEDRCQVMFNEETGALVLVFQLQGKNKGLKFVKIPLMKSNFEYAKFFAPGTNERCEISLSVNHQEAAGWVAMSVEAQQSDDLFEFQSFYNQSALDYKQKHIVLEFREYSDCAGLVADLYEFNDRIEVIEDDKEIMRLAGSLVSHRIYKQREQKTQMTNTAHPHNALLNNHDFDSTGPSDANHSIEELVIRKGRPRASQSSPQARSTPALSGNGTTREEMKSPGSIVKEGGPKFPVFPVNSNPRLPLTWEMSKRRNSGSTMGERKANSKFRIFHENSNPKLPLTWNRITIHKSNRNPLSALRNESAKQALEIQGTRSRKENAAPSNLSAKAKTSKLVQQELPDKGPPSNSKKTIILTPPPDVKRLSSMMSDPAPRAWPVAPLSVTTTLSSTIPTPYTTSLNSAPTPLPPQVYLHLQHSFAQPIPSPGFVGTTHGPLERENGGAPLNSSLFQSNTVLPQLQTEFNSAPRQDVATASNSPFSSAEKNQSASTSMGFACDACPLKSFAARGSIYSPAEFQPVLKVPARGIGPVSGPGRNDVIKGRGAVSNHHPGNQKFRELVMGKKNLYAALTVKKKDKSKIAASIVNAIRCLNPPGRFLQRDKDTRLWYDIGDAAAIIKTQQALREKYKSNNS